MDPKDGRLRIGDPFGPARPNDDDESSSWPSPGASRGTKRGRDLVGGSDATERSERFVADLVTGTGRVRVELPVNLARPVIVAPCFCGPVWRPGVSAPPL